MGDSNWRRPGASQVLSAYLDRELAQGEREKLSSRLVFDRAAARQLAVFERVSIQVDEALEPASVPDGSGVADKILASAALAETERVSFRVGKAAVIASIGLALTAGLTLIHFRRRGRLAK